MITYFQLLLLHWKTSCPRFHEELRAVCHNIIPTFHHHPDMAQFTSCIPISPKGAPSWSTMLLLTSTPHRIAGCLDCQIQVTYTWKTRCTREVSWAPFAMRCQSKNVHSTHSSSLDDLDPTRQVEGYSLTFKVQILKASPPCALEYPHRRSSASIIQKTLLSCQNTLAPLQPASDKNSKWLVGWLHFAASRTCCWILK